MKRIAIIAFAAAALFSSCCCNHHRVGILVHRGLCSEGDQFVTDENTLDALRRAQEKKGVGCVEFDVHLTVDSQIVVRHDAKIEGKLNCQTSTFDEIRAYVLPFGHQIPTLHEWLEQAKQTPDIVQAIEIKAHRSQERENALVRMVIDEVKAMGMEDQVRYLSFKPETCDEVLRIEPTAKVVLNSSNLHHSLTPDEVKEHGYYGISYNMNVILNHIDWLKKFQEYGIETYLWMVNNTYTRGIGEKLGFTWITTDFYDVVAY